MTTRRSLLTGAGTAAIGALVLPASKGLAQQRERNDRPALGASHADYFGNAVLLTHEGREVRFYDDLIRDKIVMINMMYAECEDTCPLATHNLIRVHELLGERAGTTVHMYSMSLKPEHDRPAVLKQYIAEHGVPPGWTFLTGDKADIEAIRRRLGLFERDPERDKDTTRHTNVVRIGNDALGRWVGNPALGKPTLILGAINAVDPAWHEQMRGNPAAPVEPAEHHHHHGAG